MSYVYFKIPTDISKDLIVGMLLYQDISGFKCDKCKDELDRLLMKFKAVYDYNDSVVYKILRHDLIYYYIDELENLRSE